MDDLISKRKLATELRKKQLYKDAIKIYQPLWSSTKDRYDGCGLLHCLRKTENYEDAIGLARELYKMYPDFDWCRSEVIWTLIASKLYPLNENDPLSKVVETAQKILSLKPDDLARKVIVFKVLKLAKMKNDWNMIDSWVTEINPDTLTQESIQISGNRPGWSDQAIWYNYRVRSFIENGKFSEAISIASNLLTKYPMQKKFFLRLIAVANTKLGKLNDAEQIYIELCISKRSDWWLLSEYADVLNNLEKYEDSLKVMQKAALSSSKLDPMVSLFENMGNVYKKMGRTKQAMNHFLLCKYIRERNDWKLPNTLIKSLSESNKLRQEEAYPATLTEVYSICKKEWISSIGQVEDRKSVQKKKAVKKNVVGKLNAINSMRPFCFIVTENGEDIFCLNSNLPDNSNNGDEVVFDAIPSYDRKKQRDSWKAINLRKRK